jgi:DNA-binding NarL/FixJ family response regulator
MNEPVSDLSPQTSPELDSGPGVENTSKARGEPESETGADAESAADARPSGDADADRDEDQDVAGKRIFIVDDHPVFRFGLMALLRAQGLCPCGEAVDARSALDGLVDADADLVTVDISLSGGSGLTLIKQLKSEWPNLPVLALSMHDELLFAERALRAGAVGYLQKSVEPNHLIEGIRRALRGELVVSAAITDVLLRRVIHSGAGESEPTSPIALLSNRELEVFELMGRGMRTRQVAETLHISVKTVETHQSNIKGKLGLQNASELLRAAVSWVADLEGGV